jgi:chromosome segregation ATPase
MTQFMQSLPQMAPLFADLAARNMDWQGADEIADRLKADLQAKAPHIFQGSEDKGQQKPEEQIQQVIAQLQQMQQELQAKDQESQQLQMVIEQMEKEIENKEADRRVEIEKELIKSKTAVDVAHIRSNPAMLSTLTESAQSIRQTAEVLTEDEEETEPAPQAEGSTTPMMGE